jgi:hypothetical protein
MLEIDRRKWTSPDDDLMKVAALQGQVGAEQRLPAP